MINSFLLSGELRLLIDNGYGQMIEDKTNSPIIKTYENPVRISFEKKWIQKQDVSGTPVTIEKRVYYMISDYETIVDVGLEFIYHGIRLKVMQRKLLIKFGALIGYEYELKNLTEGNYIA